MILYNGYYVTKGKIHEEWHAGIHMKYRIFNAKLFLNDSTVLVASIKAITDLLEYLFKKEEFKDSKNQCTYKKRKHQVDYI